MCFQYYEILAQGAYIAAGRALYWNIKVKRNYLTAKETWINDYEELKPVYCEIFNRSYYL